MDSQRYRRLGAASAIVQGVLTALFPQLSVRFIRRMIGENFENADTLEPTPVYRRQLRALGVGLAAAGATSLLLNRPEAGAGDETTVDAGTETG